MGMPENFSDKFLEGYCPFDLMILQILKCVLIEQELIAKISDPFLMPRGDIIVEIIRSYWMKNGVGIEGV